MRLYLAVCMALLGAVPSAIADNAGRSDSVSATTHARGSGAVMRADTNKDKVVDRVEWTAAQEKRFVRLDKDRDGKLTEDEFLEARRKTLTETQERRRSLRFKRTDSDRDGSVSLAEFVAGRERLFAQCDSNKDGRTDRRECGLGPEDSR